MCRVAAGADRDPDRTAACDCELARVAQRVSELLVIAALYEGLVVEEARAGDRRENAQNRQHDDELHESEAAASYPCSGAC